LQRVYERSFMLTLYSDRVALRERHGRPHAGWPAHLAGARTTGTAMMPITRNSYSLFSHIFTMGTFQKTLPAPALYAESGPTRWRRRDAGGLGVAWAWGPDCGRAVGGARGAGPFVCACHTTPSVGVRVYYNAAGRVEPAIQAHDCSCVAAHADLHSCSPDDSCEATASRPVPKRQAEC
jgi:hypothetical protein